MKVIAVFLICILTKAALGADDSRVPAAEAIEKALRKSQLTWPGSKPFHLVASVMETAVPGSAPRAKIEEYWVSPTKWKRIIESPDFSQVRIVNGDAISEKNTGDYFPAWLNDMVTATFDPVPMLADLRKANSLMLPPRGGANSDTCVDFPMRIDRWVICFEGSQQLLSSVFTKAYFAEFKDYKKFEGKWVSRKIDRQLDRVSKLETQINTLELLLSPDEAMFAIQQPTPLAEQITRVRVSDDMVRKLALDSTEISWPKVGQGILKGGCGIFIAADRTGHIREAYSAGCDNAAMEAPLHDTLMKWRLKPPTLGGIPVQIESLMGFSFQTEIDGAQAPPLLTDREARKLAGNIHEPRFPPDTDMPGTEYVARISIDDDGRFLGIENTHNLSAPVLGAIDKAIMNWKFKPYVKDGRPQPFKADLVFHMPFGSP
ncbi:MAG TPA: hypothetical protein VK525_00520 [Candidatus Saccharimonadales bacterium]|nr:hypothetical protein [Candidatus Saccharimonadales bacterium]